MVAKSTVAVASINVCVGMGVVFNVGVGMFMDANTSPIRPELNKINPIIIIKKIKILKVNFIMSLSITWVITGNPI